MIGSEHRVAVVGGTGVVGALLVDLLLERAASLSLIGRAPRAASPDGGRAIRSLAETDFCEFDIVFFCTPSSVSRTWVPAAASQGGIVVDNSSAFRMDPAVPLIIPEVNGDVIGDKDIAVIANPNCSTILLLVAVAPLERTFGISRLVVSTYQAVSGAGRAAMNELRSSTKASLSGTAFSPEVFRQPVGFNVFSHDSDIDAHSGYNEEELKIEEETRKILGRDVPVMATCVRVPVLRSHCESVVVELNSPATLTEFRSALSSGEGIAIVDDRSENRFPTALDATNSKLVQVGRIRPDRSRGPVGNSESGEERYSSFALFLAGDQLLKGAAWNALQIGDLALL